MRRLVVALVVSVGVLVFPGSASATHDLLDFQSAVDAMRAVDATLDPPPNDGRHDFVVGGAQTPASESGANVGISAHSGPLGEDPFGHVSYTIPNRLGPGTTFQARIKVTCVTVAGNLAVVTGVQTNAASNDSPPGNHLFALRDSGLPGGTGDGFMGFSGAVSDADCRDPIWLIDAGIAPPIERGNILIHDATP